MIVAINDLRINMKARDWCLLPYLGHPKGCPNYNDPKHEGICPPTAPLIQDFINLENPIYMIIEEFDLAGHIRKYKEKGWTDRQARCVLYWQNGVKSRLNKKCIEFKRLHPEYITTLCPEAMGVNVIATAQNAGIPIKPQPNDIVYKIALAGEPSGEGNNNRTNELLSTQMPLL